MNNVSIEIELLTRLHGGGVLNRIVSFESKKNDLKKLTPPVKILTYEDFISIFFFSFVTAIGCELI